MEANTVNCYYHPTKVILVDNNVSFLSNSQLILDKSNPTKIFENPEHAIHYILNNHQIAQHSESTVSLINECHTDLELSISKLINVNITDLVNKIQCPHRFAEISVVIVDYHLPEMNGILFCEKLKDTLIRKIVLTENSHHAIVIDGFNQGLIDKLIQKGNLATYEKIKEYVRLEQNKYFNANSTPLLGSITLDKTSALNSSLFIDIFNQTCQQSNACEYYLLDFSGSFLFLDEAGHSTFLLVQSEAELEKYYQIAKDCDAPSHIINTLKNRDKLLFLLDDNDYRLSPHDWESNLYAATKVEDNIIYYYAIISTLKNFNVSNVISYNEFRKRNG